MSERRFGYTLLAPAIFVIFAFAFFPIARNCWLSFHEKDMLKGGETRFVGARNYQELIEDSRFRRSFVNTVVFTVVSVTCEFFLGLFFALLLNRAFMLRGLARASVLVPWAFPLAIAAMAWRWIFNDTYGIFNDVLLRAGLLEAQVAWLGRPSLAMFSVIFADVWKTTPFIAIILLAGLQSIPADLYEAVSIDGARAFRKFTLVTLPLLKPYIALALLFRTIQAFGVFDLIWVLTGGGPAGSTETVSLYIYDTSFRYLNLGYGAAATVAVALMLFAVAFAISLTGRRQVEF